MKIGSRICAVLASVGISMAAQAAELSSPAIPPEDSTQVFKDAPAPWHEYLAKVRVAERIADPLQRCLAFPGSSGQSLAGGSCGGTLPFPCSSTMYLR